jgi:hypothetical protein
MKTRKMTPRIRFSSNTSTRRAWKRGIENKTNPLDELIEDKKLQQAVT